MLIFSMICLGFLILTGAILFIDCQIVEDLPEDNSFKLWWKEHIIAEDPRD
jgi:hypothetical protein